MKIIRKSDGKEFPGIMAAVNDFRCPGPCSPDCPLYPAVKLPDDTYSHMCAPAYATAHPITVATAIGCTAVPGGDPEADNPAKPDGPRFVALVKSQAVRDAQVCRNAELDPADDDAWYDIADAEIWLGMFNGEDALEKAAAYACTDVTNIRLIPIESL